MSSPEVRSLENMRAQLPPYELPPFWVPPDKRPNHPDYDNDLQKFLPRNIHITRSNASEQLGFNIRGGKEHHYGIFVSKVMPDSEPDKMGLTKGDQILSVNGINFESIEHNEAVKVLKMNTTIHMVVQYFPFGYDRTFDKSRYFASLQWNPE
ncbi:PDZ domain-containing protein 11-like isoform X1 [Octopus vulgaris]|uniref:PDZ domain-containing protein 11-like isoform X1 n=2 Tax=Octopus TaxID=6643 RepID=A0AA36BZV8_OCTVU|nr:PDZ domain-containing protein 11 [Octopus sinensis]CAI9743203.1 PDZ domain-containing protein 11-like isoform X1 [Octopus vulgaris]